MYIHVNQDFGPQKQYSNNAWGLVLPTLKSEQNQIKGFSDSYHGTFAFGLGRKIACHLFIILVKALFQMLNSRYNNTWTWNETVSRLNRLAQHALAKPRWNEKKNYKSSKQNPVGLEMNVTINVSGKWNIMHWKPLVNWRRVQRLKKRSPEPH